MSKVCGQPKTTPHCAYCEHWVGDAQLRYVSKGMGFEYENQAEGKCLKRSGIVTRAGSHCQNNYEPCREVKRAL